MQINILSLPVVVIYAKILWTLIELAGPIRLPADKCNLQLQLTTIISAPFSGHVAIPVTLK